MPKAWFLDKNCENFGDDDWDQPKLISPEKLKSSVGLVFFKVDVDDFKNAHEYWKLRKDRNYVYGDVSELSANSVEVDEWSSKIISGVEHFHEDEEFRLVLEGSAYFDVRDNEDRWVRIHVCKGDLFILSPGIYHRLNFDTGKYVKVQRLFCKSEVWKAIDRPTDDKTIPK